MEHESSTPSFQALIYPAIPKDMKLSKETPPAFLACGENDRQEIFRKVCPSCTWPSNAPERWPSCMVILASGTGSGCGKLDARGFLKRS